jgi:hypothetical protein
MKTLENIDITKPVQVYRNLHKPGCQFSVRQGGKVRCYVDSIVLTDCKFKHASPKQLSEVRTGPRQVCQWITGTIFGTAETAEFIAQGSTERLQCDPKTADGFRHPDGSRIDSAASVAICKTGCFASL